MNEWMDAEHQIERAQQLCESRRWEEALEHINNALDINPENGAWWSSKAYLLDQLGRFEEALEAYHEAMHLEPNDCDVLIAAAVDYIRLGQFHRAIELCEQVQAIDPANEGCYCHRIMLYAELGQHDLAEEMFYLAQQIDDGCPHCFWHLGGSKWAISDIPRAIYCWQRVLEIEPRYRGARRRIAEAYRRTGQVNLARDYYLAEYREDPAAFSLLLELGQMYLDAGRPDEAISKCRQVLELDPNSGRAFELLGDAMGQVANDEEALKAYQSAAALDEYQLGVHYKLGTRLMRLGRFPEARTCLHHELSLQPSDRATLMAAGNCALELGRPDEAQQWFENLVAIDDCLPGAFHNLGVCHFLRNEYELGIERCWMALALKDDYHLARHKLVLAHMHLGRWREARRLLDESLAIHPDHAAMKELKRRWQVLRTTAWLRRLSGTVRALVNPTQSC